MPSVGGCGLSGRQLGRTQVQVSAHRLSPFVVFGALERRRTPTITCGGWSAAKRSSRTFDHTHGDTLARAQTLRRPLRCRRSPIMCRLVKDEKDRASDLETCRNERHHRPAGVIGLYDDTLTGGPHIGLAVRGFRAKPSGRRIPNLRPRMAMFGRHVARIGDPLSVLSSVLFAGLHEDRPDFRDADTPGGAPPSLRNCEQPHPPQGLDDGSAWPLRCFRRRARRERVQMPKHFRSRQLSKWLGYYEPASNISPGSLADGKTCATRRYLARRGRRLNQEHQQQADRRSAPASGSHEPHGISVSVTEHRGERPRRANEAGRFLHPKGRVAGPHCVVLMGHGSERATPVSAPGSPPQFASPEAYTPKHLENRTWLPREASPRSSSTGEQTESRTPGRTSPGADSPAGTGDTSLRASSTPAGRRGDDSSRVATASTSTSLLRPAWDDRGESTLAEATDPPTVTNTALRRDFDILPPVVRVPVAGGATPNQPA